MISFRNASYRQIAFEICTAFDRIGDTAVLVGGGAATIHAPEAYISRDVDFVLPLRVGNMPDEAVLTSIGFKREGEMYRHPDTPITVEILKDTLAVGDEILDEWATIREAGKILHVLTPTQSVMDRLAGYIHWGDFNSLGQAVAVATYNQIDMDYVKQWCEREGKPSAFALFTERLNA